MATRTHGPLAANLQDMKCTVTVGVSFLILVACTALFPAAASATTSCADRFVTAASIESAEDVRAFVICAAEYVAEHGTDEALRAFNDDPRWRHGPSYVFVHGSEPSGNEATTLVFPPEQWREGTNRGELIDNFGNDYYAEAHRVVSLAGQGWIYYEFTNFDSGLDEPKQSYLIGIDWEGRSAIIGAGIYRRDLPGSCNPAEVNASALEAQPTEESLAEFVRCAAIEVEAKGFFATAVLASDPRWLSGTISVSLVNPADGTLAFSPMGEGYEGMDFNSLFGGRDLAGVGSAFGESFSYFSHPNPNGAAPIRTVGFAKRVIVDGMPMLVYSGYFADERNDND